MVQFHCYDVVDEKTNFPQRDGFINFNFPLSGSLKRTGCDIAFNIEEIEVKHANFLEQGYEGSILRKDATYECKRSWTLMKVKDFSDSEAKIIDWVEGKGKRIGTIGKFVAVDVDGNEFGMPVMDKFEYLQNNFKEMQGWVGKTATFTYFERTKAGSYRHPLFKTIRDYE